jgi:hypothetical protein
LSYYFYSNSFQVAEIQLINLIFNMKMIYSILLAFAFIIGSSRLLIADSSVNNLCFDGVNDYVTVPHHASLNPGAGSSWTIEVWVKLLNNTTPRNIIAKRHAGGNFNQISLFKNGPDVINGTPGKRICFVYQQSGTVSRGCYTNTDVVDGNWHHIAAVADQAANTLRIYFDGVLQPTTMALNVGAWPDPSNTDPLYLGWASTGSIAVDGSMRDARIWKSARTQAQINQYMYTGIPNPGSETNLVAYYPCDEGTGQVVNDHGSGAHHGMLGSTPSVDANDPNWCLDVSPEEAQNCLDFDGVNDYVQVTDGGTLLSSALTGEAWIKLNSYPASGALMGTVFAKYDNATNAIVDYGGYSLYITPAGYPTVVIMSDNLNVNNSLSGSQQLEMNRWYHLAFTYSATELRLYVDGILANSVSNPVVMGSTANPFEIGRLSNKSQVSYPYGYFAGQIEEIRIYNTVLSQDAIRDDMHRELIGPELQTNLKAYYRFNHTYGSIALDRSSNAKNGVLYNMDPFTDWVISTAPIPFNSIATGSWESNSTWNTGQKAPVNGWSRIKVNNEVTLNTSKEAITVTITPGGTLNIVPAQVLTLTGDFLIQNQ